MSEEEAKEQAAGPQQEEAPTPEPEAEEAPAEESAAESEEKATRSDDDGHVVKQKPQLPEDLAAALRERNLVSARRPRFRRQEWFRYKKLGGKNAPWRRPRGMHSKMRMHLKYRPPVVRVGFRGPAAARELHPSGFEDVLVHRPGDLEGLDPKTQAARIGRTVGGRKAEAIQTRADELGIRILNRRRFE